jgi:hypothetical protein
MDRRTLRIAILTLSIVAAGAAFATLGLTVAASGAAQPASVGLVAIDADPSGNGPRTVGTIDECISASVGESVDIDIVVPKPGIPGDRGIAGYDFTLAYDPAIVWTESDWINDSQLRSENLLLAQASGSGLVAITDPTPNMFGSHRSVAVDIFGPKGIEPAGASERGPGVIDRLTLLPQGTGSSPLILIEVILVDDDSQRITVDAVQEATIVVGGPCPEASQAATPRPSPSETTPTPSPPEKTPTPTALEAASPGPAALSSGGGPPPAGDTMASWLIPAGLGAALVVAGVVVLYLARRRDPSRTTGHS